MRSGALSILSSVKVMERHPIMQGNRGEILMSAKHGDRRRFPANRTCALIMAAALFAAVAGQAASADEMYRANPKPPTDGLVGSNYTPAYAVNQV